jgi:3-phosphoshikimate 1-carboxyvinyltransferase
MGADIVPTTDGMIINGGKELKGCEINSADDHRIAMAFAIAGLVAEGKTKIPGDSCINISYPGFKKSLNSLVH